MQTKGIRRNSKNSTLCHESGSSFGVKMPLGTGRNTFADLFKFTRCASNNGGYEIVPPIFFAKIVNRNTQSKWHALGETWRNSCENAE